MQTIIKLPQERVDLMSAGVNKSIVDKLEDYLSFAKDIQTLFRRLHHLRDFIEKSVTTSRVYYVKTFSENNEDLSESREFICFGEYHRNIKEQYNLFFRIDQDWTNFNFPLVDNIQDLKEYFSFLSGTTVDIILPSIILEQKYLIDNSEIISNHNTDTAEFDKLYLFSTDYFGTSFFFDTKANVFYLKPHSKTVEKSQFGFKQWIDNGLNAILNPKTP